MKIQNLAIIFVIIIIPISLVLSVYTQFQIETLKLQTLYDTKLTSATYDAIKAFQLNTSNSTMSDLSNSKLRDLEASVETFKNSLMSTFGLNGYSEEDLNQYIPALVYTLYDGFYIYSPYTNNNYLYEWARDESGQVKYDSHGNVIYATDSEGKKIPIDDNDKTLYGLKPYIAYSCRYKRKDIDIVITYSLDNYITVQGTVNGTYVSDEGYLIDGITKDANGRLWYNGVEITTESNLKEHVVVATPDINNGTEYPYIKLNGTKYYYYMGNPSTTSDDEIFYISNGNYTVQGNYKGVTAYNYYNSVIANNNQAKTYYTNAMNFTNRMRTMLKDITYNDAYEMIMDNSGQYKETQLYPGDTRKIFEFVDSSGINIENDLSNFNQHRLAIIRHKIETNLSIAISNYNRYSQAEGIQFQMPELKDDEWELILDNIALISFVQGMNIGGKIYNGYTIVNNTESKEVVQEENIYILGKEEFAGAGQFYYRIGDKYLEINNGENIYDSYRTATGTVTVPAGRINLDFERNYRILSDSSTVYYYPMKKFNASYSSIVTQNNVTTFDDIYDYVNKQNYKLKKAFYMAIGREREGAYKTLRTEI